ncbi:MAG: DUF5615 family PIN-like protein [Caldilineaceae bacterium]|nr:DUF5615 family PIN-like protein [Caldilineaceae bacterium]MCB0138822.1 DUF5615 family PIN-like protein [Caldilineaceae bacterium]
MNFLLDMGIAQSTALFLRAGGHNAIHLREQGLQRMEDEDIILKARAEHRIVLTHDLDFGRIMALSGENLPSVVTFRLQDMRAVNVNHYLSIVMKRYAKLLYTGVLISVTEEAIRARPLPV